jgi:hypothetical protein
MRLGRALASTLTGTVRTVAAAAIALILACASAAAREQVDLELVLAVDVSMSMDLEEQKYQRRGYVDAFRSKAIIDAIQSGPNRRIAVTYVEWAGAGVQKVVVPWRIIANADDGAAFASLLEGQPILRARMTSISGALLEAEKLFEANEIDSIRRVVDVSGDGPNNSGAKVDETRDRLVKNGITINGLALKFKRPEGPYSYFDLPDLDKYYAACVIGGPASFMISVQEVGKFGQAIRQKLLQEIATAPPAKPQRVRPQHPRLIRTQFRIGGGDADKPTYDCLAGEKRWEQYQLEQW